MLQPTDPRRLNNKITRRAQARILDAHSEGEIEWSLEVDGGRELVNRVGKVRRVNGNLWHTGMGGVGVVSAMRQKPGLAEAPGCLGAKTPSSGECRAWVATSCGQVECQEERWGHRSAHGTFHTGFFLPTDRDGAGTERLAGQWLAQLGTYPLTPLVVTCFACRQEPGVAEL